MPRVLTCLLLALLLSTPLRAQPSSDDLRVDTDLQAKLERLVEGFRGDVGVYARHLPSGRTAAFNADTLFPTASMVKVPILLKTFDLLEKDSLAYDQ